MGALWRVRGRDAFASLSRDGRRGRSGPVTVVYLSVERGAPDVARPRAAYAVGRSVGSAVVRNTVRRRLRSLMAASASELAPGDYLVQAGPAAAALPYSQLGSELSEALRRAAA